mgnify:CR=1 FL=1|tara:strand:- start:2944 stop:3531 length:588 start_codon:yes stop_codon:yes gene_type:complete
MSLDGSNVDTLISQLGYESRGFVRHNRFSVDLTPAQGNQLTDIPAFSVKIPGWDVTTVTETNVADPNFNTGGHNIRHMPYRKSWNQGLFITFYMQYGSDNRSAFNFINKWNNQIIQPQGPGDGLYDAVRNGSLRVNLGESPTQSLHWTFGECYPRVLYPIDLKPVEDFAPVLFSVQFTFRYYDVRDGEGNLVGAL